MTKLEAKPRHLYVVPKGMQRDFPKEGYRKIDIEMTAELEEKSIVLQLSLVMREGGGCADVLFADEDPHFLTEDRIYITTDKDGIIQLVGRQIGVLRRSKRSDIAILNWVRDRVKEYVNSLFL